MTHPLADLLDSLVQHRRLPVGQSVAQGATAIARPRPAGLLIFSSVRTIGGMRAHEVMTDRDWNDGEEVDNLEETIEHPDMTECALLI